ncbi:DNA adenine methylase [Achromobacter sp. RTa]|uniref:DNA adenine methylase n=1 Tax=Achromobacter sp. RTa TaxID=1532557 RepID=UPI0005BA8053|nr:DNA adenine methylase [Achromobacter sp. RTa]
MGSKRAMLGNGLGDVLEDMVGRHRRFVDLFTGSASVAWHVAQRYPIATFAFDLQRYSAVLAAAVVQRNNPVNPVRLWNDWVRRATPKFEAFCAPDATVVNAAFVIKARKWACQFDQTSLVHAYAGHYYSPVQACWIQALRDTVPTKSPNREVCLAALVMAASKCAASPGHTAQPFQPTDTAIKYLEISWHRNFCADVQAALAQLAPIHARVSGKSDVGDANEIASQLQPGDLVFIDPPYSAVQYSRFYHVLEAIAVGATSPVFGVGRYPPLHERPSSKYSQKTTAKLAIQDLLVTLAAREVSAIITFPDHECSNGVDADMIKNYASEIFEARTQIVSSVFSTLGGPALSGQGPRLARLNADEMILCLEPR